jgi:hypothetical protein
MDLKMSGLGLLVSRLETRSLRIRQHRAGHGLVLRGVYVVRRFGNGITAKCNSNHVGTNIDWGIVDGMSTITIVNLLDSAKRFTERISDYGNEGSSSPGNTLAKLVPGFDGKVSGDVSLSALDTGTIDQAEFRIST